MGKSTNLLPQIRPINRLNLGYIDYTWLWQICRTLAQTNITRQVGIAQLGGYRHTHHRIEPAVVQPVMLQNESGPASPSF